MTVPTTKHLLDKIKVGEVWCGIIPCSPDYLPVPGDKVTIKEATFDLFSVPRFVLNGASVPVKLTLVNITADTYLGFTLCALEWDEAERIAI